MADPVEVVRRVAGVQAQVASAAELAIRVRQSSPTPGAVERALLVDRSLVKTWAMRGTPYLLPAAVAGDYLSLMASLRGWERPAWPKAAAPRVVHAYLEAHGPATAAVFNAWLSRGLKAGVIKGWFEAMRGELAPVAVEGRPMYLMSGDLDSPVGQEPSDSVHLLGGFDQYLLGAGTSAEHVIAYRPRKRCARGRVSEVYEHLTTFHRRGDEHRGRPPGPW